MAILINEQKMVSDNVFKYEERIKSPTSRFIDTSPTFVKYFHINNNESTTDNGFRDVDLVVGKTSPIRFDSIENFPIYGIEQIVIQLQDDDMGLDGSYEGDGIILPNTIKPLQNDFFIIPYLKDDYIFRITDIQYDTILPDNFYKFSFKLEYIDEERLRDVENQVISENICDISKFGTETGFILNKKEFIELQDIYKMYHEMCEFYKAMFYSDRHNVFLGQLDSVKTLYDPLQTEFINKHELFKEKNDLTSLILTNEYDDAKRKYKYNKSVYKYIELRDKKLLTNFKYTTRPGVTLHESTFYYWHDKSVEVLDIPQVMPENAKNIFSDQFVLSIQMNAEVEGDYAKLIQQYVRKEELGIKDIPLTLDTELMYLNNSLEVFFFTPIILYIIKDIINTSLSNSI